MLNDVKKENMYLKSMNKLSLQGPYKKIDTIMTVIKNVSSILFPT